MSWCRFQESVQLSSFRGVAQFGSAPHWGCGGQRFKSSRPDQLSTTTPIELYENQSASKIAPSSLLGENYS